MGDEYYPEGGAKDILKHYTTLDSAKAYANKVIKNEDLPLTEQDVDLPDCDWIHILNVNSGKIEFEWKSIIYR